VSKERSYARAVFTEVIYAHHNSGPEVRLSRPVVGITGAAADEAASTGID
jgi:hypothetical protein